MTRVPGSRALLGVLLALAFPAAGQSVLAAGGLGIPMDPVDGRGRALGSVGTGLFGTGVVPGDPVGAADLSVPTLTVSMQSAWLEVARGGAASTNRGTRFPALGVSFPVRDWGVLTLTYGGVLDQRWTLERQGSVELGGGEQATFTDAFVSDGGVSAVRLGFGRRISPRLAVGAAVGALTGNLTRSFVRSFESPGVGVGVAPFETGGRWRYSGPTASVGVMAEVGELLRATGTITWSGTLDAVPIEETVAATGSYDMPMEIRAAVSGALAPQLDAVLSLAWADWAGAADDLLGGGSAGGVLALGAGIEWEAPTLFGRGLPVRLGWRRAELPFRPGSEEGSQEGSQDTVESSYALGLGFMMSAFEGIPLASIDVAVERGSRSGGAVSEDFWRSTVSLRIAGF